MCVFRGLCVEGDIGVYTLIYAFKVIMITKLQ